MYELELIPINESADQKFFNDWINSNYSILGIIHAPTLIVIKFPSEPSQEDKDVIRDKYNSLTSLNVLSNPLILQEIERKEEREKYGIEVYNFAAAESRLNRLSITPLPSHEQYRKDKQDPLNDIIATVIKGDFKTVYEKLNEFVTSEHITIETIITYRILVASYIVSNPISYTDIFGIKVKGGKYPEHVGDAMDSFGIIEDYDLK